MVSVVARRHGLSPQQVFTWRREARKAAETPTFVPAVMTPELAPEPPPRQRARRTVPRRGRAAIEMEASGVTVRIGAGASPAMIAAVIGALRSAP